MVYFIFFNVIAMWLLTWSDQHCSLWLCLLLIFFQCCKSFFLLKNILKYFLKSFWPGLSSDNHTRRKISDYPQIKSNYQKILFNLAFQICDQKSKPRFVKKFDPDLLVMQILKGSGQRSGAFGVGRLEKKAIFSTNYHKIHKFTKVIFFYTY
jgi:hypothetical protein